MPPELAVAPKPLLTIAVPTWNRSALLRGLLKCLADQRLDPAEVEVLVSNNASPDDTAEVVQSFADRLPLRSFRQPENIGSDRNFVFCFEQARGRYFWLCSDDDLIVPGGVEILLRHLRSADYDIIHATSYGFIQNAATERNGDPLGRRFHQLRRAEDTARLINVMFTFISGIIVNRERLEELPHEEPASFVGTNLVQLSWSLPLLLHHRRSLILWERIVAGRRGNSGGYSIGSVFGKNLSEVTHRCLPGRADLARIILNVTVRRWFPPTLYDYRAHQSETYSMAQSGSILRRVFASNWRFWLFSWPVLHLPLRLAHVWVRGGIFANKLIYMVRTPGFFRKET